MSKTLGWPEVEEIRARQLRHEFAGRISGASSNIASFCSCGLAFFGNSVAEADNGQRVHSSDALIQPVGSLSVSDERWAALGRNKP